MPGGLRKAGGNRRNLPDGPARARGTDIHVSGKPKDKANEDTSTLPQASRAFSFAAFVFCEKRLYRRLERQFSRELSGRRAWYAKYFTIGG
jgi:hypothetical protein